MFVRIIALWVCASMAQLLAAQTLSEPCARVLVGGGRDSVEWSASPCANFNGYVIYGRAGTAGQFQRLDTITTATQTTYVHANPSEQTWQYQIGMLCGGIETLTTIAVSNQRPITPDLRNVSIINGKPVLSWDASPSPEVTSYQVYKENPYGSGNYFPYPAPNQLVTGTQFTDATATDLLVRYAIVAVSPCNKSLLGEGGIDGTTGPHTSIFLRGTIDSCTQLVKLQWNPYEHWREGVEQYEIWLSINGQPSQPIDTVQTTLYTYPNAQDGDSLAFYVRALERNRGSNSAKTNIWAIRARTNRPMNYIYLTNISLNAANAAEISWVWDTDVDYQSGAMLRDGNTIQALTAPVQQSNTTTDGQLTATEAHRYTIQTTDLCGFDKTSSAGYNLVLTGKAGDNFINQLKWQPFRLEYATVHHYELYRIVGNQTTRIASTTDSTWRDDIDINQQAQYQAGYYVVAVSELQLPNGRNLLIESRSNTVWVLQNAVLRVPNAFAPDGINNVFKPHIVFNRSITDYSMLIFDRYGQIIFQSNESRTGWNGGEYPQGVYVYQIRFTQADGTPVEERGTFVLLR